MQLLRNNCFSMCPIEIENKKKQKENKLISKLLILVNALKSPILGPVHTDLDIFENTSFLSVLG